MLRLGEFLLNGVIEALSAISLDLPVNIAIRKSYRTSQG